MHHELLGTWAGPPDHAAWAALAIAVALALLAVLPFGPRLLASLLDFAAVDDLSRRRRFLTVGGFFAAFLSLGYVAFYLRGGPRSLEGAAYFLQGRALAHGDLAWSVPEPSASFRGALRTYHAATGEVAGALPPGFPLLLAVGALFGAPLVTGPLLAAALVAATYFLARELFLREPGVARRADESALSAEAVGRVAIGVSIVSAALRYETAEPTAVSASALALTLALACALRARRHASTGSFVLAGLAVGYAFAARPLSALPVAVAVALLALATPKARRARALVAVVAGAAPGLALLLAANRAATGSPFHFAAFDAALAGPHVERLAGGAIFGAALARLRAHALDVANLEPLALLVLAPVVLRARENRAPLVVLAVVLGQALVWAPFGVAGDDVPGLGSRLYADVLPLEHALVAFALATLLPKLSLVRKALVYLALAAFGFAVHAAFAHEALASSGTGRPAYEPDVAREANVTHGLLFFDDDQGFDLAYVPEVLPSHGLVAVRLRNDDDDRLLYDSLGHPAVHRYVPAKDGPPQVVFWAPPSPQTLPGVEETWRFEAESEWPPLAARGASASAVDAASTCASNGLALDVTPVDGGGEIEIALPVPRDGTWRVLPRAFRHWGAGAAHLVLRERGNAAALAEWTWTDGPAPGEPADPTMPARNCLDLPGQVVHLVGANHPYYVLEARSGAVGLDKTSLVWVAAPAGP